MALAALRTDGTLALAAQGDAAAWRALVDAQGPRVWSICRRLSPDPEDCYQEVWEKVMRALPAFDPAGPASSPAQGIVRAA